MNKPPQSPSQEKVLILGGGIASLAAAHALTREPGWRERYEITVLQMGWRLGGKGASGRNQALSDRIEEHGIHVFFGFYDNAFRILRECYEELERPPGAPLAGLTDAFKPAPRITFAEQRRGRWSLWPWDFPANDARLGEGGPIPTPWGYVLALLDSMEEWYEQVMTGAPADLREALSARTPELARALRPLLGADAMPELIERLWQGKSPSAFAAVRKVIAALRRSAADVLGDPRRERPADRAALARLVRRVRIVRHSARWMGREMQKIDALRRSLTLLDFATTTILGLIEDGLVYPPEDWRPIDGVDLKRWLARHGAEEATADCALIRGMYAGIFTVGPEVGAGTMLQYTLRLLFTYRGAVLYKMQAGMGDVVFAPLYEVLARRGVRFEFFHRVDRLELDAARRRVARVHVGRQVALADGPYRPLIDVGGLPCWPSEPLYEQLVDGERLRASGESLEDAWTGWPDALPPRVLEEGRDFDRVVLGISLGALPALCKELIDDPRNPRFRRMVESLATTQTQAMQLWMRPDLEGLGWSRGNAITIPYEEPFDTWTDMAHLIPRESWPQGEVGSIAYLCSPLPDEEPVPPPGSDTAGYARRQHARVKAHARDWLEQHAGWLWPRAAAGPGARGFDYSLLADPAGASGSARLDAQHFAAPQNPSDRYNLSLPGTSAYRLPADGSGYPNLVLAGDWTLNPINAGCVEAATMSGLLAARAISGEPRVIPGDWLSPLAEVAVPAARRIAVPAAARPLPAYVDRDVNDTPAAPFVARGTRMFVFPLAADQDRLAALCDRMLHLGGPMRYRPLAGLVLLYCQDNAELESAAPRARIRELDFGFLVPLVAREPGRPPRLVSFVPYLWVDSELACRAGREMYGYPKAAAELRMPSPATPAKAGGVFTVDGMVAEPDATGGRWRMRRLLEARPVSGGASARRRAAGPVEALLEALREAGGAGAAWDLARGAAGDLVAGVVPMVFLKQFRDVADPGRACYQAIVEAPVRLIGKVRGGGALAAGYEVAVADRPGAPLASRLGLRAARRSHGELVAQARTPVWLDFDFVLEPGRVVWSSNDEAAPSPPPGRRTAEPAAAFSPSDGMEPPREVFYPGASPPAGRGGPRRGRPGAGG